MRIAAQADLQIKHLRELGALGSDMTLGHGVWVTEDDLDILAETGTCVCHNCSSNLRLRSGIAPLNAYRKRDINIALGIDEAGLNDNRDMLTEMRLALRMHRVPGLKESDVPTSSEVFRMATSGGAATTPFGTKIGKLEKGYEADMVLFSWDQIAYPYLSNDVSVVDALVQRARMNGVFAVIVAGDVLLREDDTR
jgi:5-methylthioadenosine/S-adenosylhomocysteine deaminase